MGRGRHFLWRRLARVENGDRETTIPQKRAYLSFLAVKQEYRGRGIGSALIDYAEQCARKSGITELTIQVERSNERARQLYERKGFCVIVRDAPDAVLLLKKI